MKVNRIISLVPAATEMVAALGLLDRLVGVTQECDYPEEARSKTVVVKSALDLSGLAQGEIDQAVSDRLQSGASLYEVNETLLRQLKPDLVLVQDLCQVCAPSGGEVLDFLKTLNPPPQILIFSPHYLAGIESNLLALAQASGTQTRAVELLGQARQRRQVLQDRVQSLPRRPRVFFMEWLDPIYGGGHWVPEMITLAGGIDSLGRPGRNSEKMEWESVLRWAPEVLIVAPCGYDLARTLGLAGALPQRTGWEKLPAVQNAQVYAVDGNAYFARPGPRVMEGLELLAHLIHPDRVPWNGPRRAFQRL